jgi:CRP-like cAMP-binding protein
MAMRDQIIMEQDTAGQEMYILVKGEVVVIKDGEQLGYLQVDRLQINSNGVIVPLISKLKCTMTTVYLNVAMCPQEGAFFGEMALLAGGNSVAPCPGCISTCINKDDDNKSAQLIMYTCAGWRDPFTYRQGHDRLRGGLPPEE